MNDDNAHNILGGCYCDTVRFSIAAGTQPVWAGYCHCQDCRKAHAATLYQAVYQELAVSDTWNPCQHIFSGESILDLSLLHDQLPKHLGGATFDKPA